MSTEKRKSISKEILEEEYVVPMEKKQCLQTAIYDISKIQPFLGSVMQCLDIIYTHSVPRAGIMFDTDAKKWHMLINPFWFVKKLSKESRKAILLHEMYHVVHKHPLRAPFLRLNPNRRRMMNIAMDMAINQYIIGLPNGCDKCPSIDEQMTGAQCENKLCPGNCILLEYYYDTDSVTGKKTTWEANRPFEYYYMKLIQRYEDNENQNEAGQQEFDSHQWDSNADESEMLDATEDLMKRAIQKQGLSYSDIPKFARELLDDLAARRAELNYKAILLAAIKKNASGFNKEYSWTRKSRRWGNKSPGTRQGKLPIIQLYIDTSGSISIEEANEFLGIVDEFLRVGSRECHVHLWHTTLYHSQKHKLGKKIDRDVFQSGGTCLEDTMQHIIDNEPDLAIVITDGCYSDIAIESKLKPNTLMPQTLFIISREGNQDHPLRRIGETIKIPETDQMGRDKRLEQQ